MRTALRASVAIAAGLVTVASAVPATAADGHQTRAGTTSAFSRLDAASAAQLSRNVDDRVIIVMRNQYQSVPDVRSDIAQRESVTRSSQAPVVADLRQTHARSVHQLAIVNAVAATVSQGEAARLADDPAVARVVQDEPIPVQSSLPAAAAARSAAATGVTPLPGACASGTSVQLDPQAVETIHAASQSGTGDYAQSLGITGTGVKVGFIADGLDIDNPDFIRSNGSKVFTDYEDFSGSGTASPTDGGEAFLDASSIAAQGRETYNIAGYGVGLNRTCNIRILGVAPGASLVGLDVFGDLDEAFNSVFLEAINYAVNTAHVNVLNESFGSNPFPDTASLDLDKQANDAAVAAGVTVTVSSGDAGSSNTIGSPATDPRVISVGASTTYRSYAQAGVGGITDPRVKGWLDNNISGLSSGGFDQSGRTVDLVAPGDLNWALCTPDPAMYAACTDFSGKPASVELSGGTSEASPLTAGTAALVVQAYARTHGGRLPSPATVKRIIVSTAQDISAPADQQGAGLLDAYAAVRAAASYPGASARAGSTLLKSQTQLDVVAGVGHVRTLHDTITNAGASTATYAIRGRALGGYSTISSGRVTLRDKTGNEATRTFRVSAGQARLSASLAYNARGTSSNYPGAVNVSLIDPRGRLAEYSLSQGAGNFTSAQVADPVAGTWTALITGSPSAVDGTTGPVRFAFQQARWTHFGSVSPSLVQLRPGASRTITLHVRTPRSPGDAAGSVQFVQRGGTTTTVPVTLRSLIPRPRPSTRFTGVLTGGNGREVSTGQTNYYQLAVGRHVGVLNAEVDVPNSHDTFLAELVDPNGLAESAVGNSLLSQTARGQATTVDTRGSSLHVLSPQPGRWTLLVDFYNQVAGTATSQPFRVTVTERHATVRSSGIPTSRNDHLRSGKVRHAVITVTNTTDAPEEYFLDPRSSARTTMTLLGQTSTDTADPVTGTPPTFLVPSHTSSLTARVVATRPSFFDVSYGFGDPDLISERTASADTSARTYTNAHISSGDWQVTPFQDGPDGAAGAPKATAHESMTVRTAGFARSVTSPTGDLWLDSVSRDATFTPYRLEPGQSVRIPVTIRATGRVGSVVRGTIWVTQYAAISPLLATNEGGPSIFSDGSDIAGIPFAYRIVR